jgi:trigger factor
VKSAVETLDATKVKLTVEVTAADLAPALKSAYAQIAKDLTVPGFRKGKVPPRIIEQRIGFPAVLDYALQTHLSEWYGQAVEQARVRPLGRAEIDVTDQPDAANRDKDLVFTAEVEIRPEIDLPDLADLTLTVPAVEVSQADVDLGIESLRERFATLLTVDRPAAEGDFVTLDLKASIGEEEVDSVAGVSYQVGAGTMLDGLDEALDGLSAGEVTTFEAPLAGGAHEGTPALVEVRIEAVKERELPAVDEEFAELASAMDSVEELREDMARRLGQVKRMQQLGQAREALVRRLAEEVEIPVPAGILGEMMRQEAGEEPDEAVKSEIEDRVSRRNRDDLLLDALAEKVDVKVSQADLVQFMLSAAQSIGADPSEFVESAQASGRMPTYIAEVARSKAIDLAMAQTRVVDEAGEPVDLVAIAAEAAPEPYDPDADIEFDDDLDSDDEIDLDDEAAADEEAGS